MALLTLFMGVGLTLYMLGWKGLNLGIPKMYHRDVLFEYHQAIVPFC